MKFLGKPSDEVFDCQITTCYKHDITRGVQLGLETCKKVSGHLLTLLLGEKRPLTVAEPRHY